MTRKYYSADKNNLFQKQNSKITWYKFVKIC